MLISIIKINNNFYYIKDLILNNGLINAFHEILNCRYIEIQKIQSCKAAITAVRSSLLARTLTIQPSVVLKSSTRSHGYVNGFSSMYDIYFIIFCIRLEYNYITN